MSISENEIALEDVPDGAQEASCFESPGAPDAGDWAAMAERLHPGASARPPLSRVPSRSYAHVKRVLDVALSLCDSVALIDTPSLHHLPAGEMVGSGLIERLFSGENARFDPETRTVRLR